MDSIKPNLTNAPPGPTQKGSAGYDNMRDDIEKVKKIREGSIEKVPVFDNDIMNKKAVDILTTNHPHQDVTTTAGPTFDNIDITNDIVVGGSVDGVDIAGQSAFVIANTTHKTSVGTDHGYINQDVQTTASPTFRTLTSSPAAGKNFIGRYSSVYPSNGEGYYNLGTNNISASVGGLTIQTNNAGTMTDGLLIDGYGNVTIPNGDLTVDTTTLKVDSTNNRVGIGTATPSCKLDVKGAISSNQATITASADDTDVSGINTLLISTTAGAVVIGGFKSGVEGQILYVARTDETNDLTFEHLEGAGDQDLIMHEGSDETIDGYGGFTFFCDGTDWYDCSHAKHV